MSFDVVTLGEAMVRLWVGNGERIETAAALRVSVGGSEANVAIALARSGRKVSWMSRLPDSYLGKRIANEIRMHGVDLSAVSWSSDGRAGLYFVELSGYPREVSVLYDRRNSAASQMSILNSDLRCLSDCKVFHLSGITPALSATSKELCREAIKIAKSKESLVTFDVNYRSALWSVAEAKKEVSHLAFMASLVVCTSKDAIELFGFREDEENLAEKLSTQFSNPNVIVTHGSSGVSWSLGGHRGFLPAQPTETVDRLGAGDGFMAGVLLGLLDGNIIAGISRGQAMAVLKRGIFGDQLLSSESEVSNLINGNIVEIRR